MEPLVLVAPWHLLCRRATWSLLDQQTLRMPIVKTPLTLIFEIAVNQPFSDY